MQLWRGCICVSSGGNDGMGFPFLFLAIFLIGEPGVGKAIGKWIYETCLFQILLSIVIGVIVGFVARKILQWSERNGLIDKPSFLCFGIALALFLMSMTGFSGSDDVLACFAAGNAFSWDDWFRRETEEAHLQDVIDLMLNLTVFVYIGAIIPWKEFSNQDIGLTPWRLVVIAILILLFRRLPIVVALKPFMPAIKTYREAVFSGWFGPMGVGAVFLSMVAKEEMEEIYHEEAEKPIIIELISPVVLFVVLSSTLVHGSTIPLFQLGKRIRTRTLSITSTGSSNAARLRKENLRRSSDMDETRRNTIINTIQRNGGSGSKSTAIDMMEDDTPEEDFLPNDEESSGDSRVDDSHTIRFAEPVNPRTASQRQKQEPGHAFEGEDEREQQTTYETIANEEASVDEQSESSHRPIPTSERDPQKAADMPGFSHKDEGKVKKIYHTSIPQHVQVWEETHHVVIEDKTDTRIIVIDKHDPDWKKRFRLAIKELDAATKE